MQTEFPERYITLGLKIAYYRKKAGLTQEVLAERIGKSVNFVGQVEGTGTIRGVSLETLFKIAQVLKIQSLNRKWLPMSMTAIRPIIRRSKSPALRTCAGKSSPFCCVKRMATTAMVRFRKIFNRRIASLRFPFPSLSGRDPSIRSCKT